jgi:hypothetical protein
VEEEVSGGHFLRVHVPGGTEFVNLSQARKIELIEGTNEVIVWFSETDKLALSGKDAEAVHSYVTALLLTRPE